MHFRHNAFSRNQSKSTVVARNRTIHKTILGSSATATDLDFLHLNLLYCEGTCMFIRFYAFNGYFAPLHSELLKCKNASICICKTRIRKFAYAKLENASMYMQNSNSHIHVYAHLHIHVYAKQSSDGVSLGRYIHM